MVQSSLQLLTSLYRQAANRYLLTFRTNRKPDHRGYESYLEADEAWLFYQKTGVVPLAPIDGGVAASILVRDQPSMDDHHSLPLAQASPTYHAPRVGHPAHVVFQTTLLAKFYIVHVGYSPGVYNSL
jgi:hypothetical protein